METFSFVSGQANELRTDVDDIISVIFLDCWQVVTPTDTRNTAVQVSQIWQINNIVTKALTC